MKQIQTLDACFPNYTLAIRRLHRDDPAFRELCDDYVEALRASFYWRSLPNQSKERSKQYLEIAADLEAEIRKTLRSRTH